MIHIIYIELYNKITTVDLVTCNISDAIDRCLSIVDKGTYINILTQLDTTGVYTTDILDGKVVIINDRDTPQRRKYNTYKRIKSINNILN